MKFCFFAAFVRQKKIFFKYEKTFLRSCGLTLMFVMARFTCSTPHLWRPFQHVGGGGGGGGGGFWSDCSRRWSYIVCSTTSTSSSINKGWWSQCGFIISSFCHNVADGLAGGHEPERINEKKLQVPLDKKSRNTSPFKCIVSYVCTSNFFFFQLFKVFFIVISFFNLHCSSIKTKPFKKRT